MRRQKQKQKSYEQKEYQLLKSIHDQVEEQLYCLKKQEDIIMKLIEREEKKLSESQRKILETSLYKSLEVKYDECQLIVEEKSQYRQKNMGQHIMVHNQNDSKETFPTHNHIQSHNGIPCLGINSSSHPNGNCFCTGHKYQPVHGRKTSRREEIFKMDEQLYEQDDEDYSDDQ